MEKDKKKEFLENSRKFRNSRNFVGKLYHKNVYRVKSDINILLPFCRIKSKNILYDFLYFVKCFNFDFVWQNRSNMLKLELCFVLYFIKLPTNEAKVSTRYLLLVTSYLFVVT